MMQSALLNTSRSFLVRGPSKAHSQRRQQASRKPLVAGASNNDSVPSFFDSKIVQEELARWAMQGNYIQTIQELFPFTDVQGKRTMLAYLEGLSEQVQVFYTRLRLSEDPRAKTYLSWLQAIMLEHEATWDGFFQTEQAFYLILRKMVNAEESLELAGDCQAVARIQENETAWIQGRYQEWAQSRPGEAVALALVPLELNQ